MPGSLAAVVYWLRNACRRCFPVPRSDEHSDRCPVHMRGHLQPVCLSPATRDAPCTRTSGAEVDTRVSLLHTSTTSPGTSVAGLHGPCGGRCLFWGRGIGNGKTNTPRALRKCRRGSRAGTRITQNGTRRRHPLAEPRQGTNPAKPALQKQRPSLVYLLPRSRSYSAAWQERAISRRARWHR